MNYEYLSKIFYKNPEQFQQIYNVRFSSPTTKHLDFYIKQFNRNKEYPAFLCYTEELVLLTDQIYKKYEKFLMMVKQVPPIVLEQFTLWSLVGEIMSTNDIEGVTSTRRELSEIIKNNSTTSRFSSIVKMYNALRFHEIFKFKTCEDIRALYDRFAHKEIVDNNAKYKLDGKIFRRESVDIISATNKTLHRGMFPEEKIIKSMNVALQMLNDESTPFLVRVSIFHYLFGYIHPFYDRNGRTARFIVSYFLSENFNYLLALRLSLTIKRQRKKYYALFSDTNADINCGDLTPFVLGFMEIISSTFDDIDVILNHKMEQLEKYERKLKTLIPNDELTQKIYEILLQAGSFFGQGVSMDTLMELTGKSRNTIKSRFKATPANHIVVKSNKKNFYKVNMKIFFKSPYRGDTF